MKTQIPGIFGWLVFPKRSTCKYHMQSYLPKQLSSRCHKQKLFRFTYCCHPSCVWDCVASDHVVYSNYKWVCKCPIILDSSTSSLDQPSSSFCISSITRTQPLSLLYWPLDGQNEHVPLHVVNLAFDHVFLREKGHVQISQLHYLLMSQAEAF